ncbi:hypothetical protein DY000_02027676 [Brassica cretica]|uniref:Secreted protein n=1 Tax=Brassica cretica TaxID=69181 RepID=A0ABQ7E4S4_BRACR|nr:hypothetical protein DY000_02027676 [Brassica cretica]
MSTCSKRFIVPSLIVGLFARREDITVSRSMSVILTTVISRSITGVNAFYPGYLFEFLPRSVSHDSLEASVQMCCVALRVNSGHVSSSWEMRRQE